MERPDFKNPAFSSYLQSWIGQKIDQCFWLANDDPLPRFLFSLKRQKPSFSTSSHIFHYVLTLSYRCISPVYSTIHIMQIPSPNISLFCCIMKPKLNAFSILTFYSKAQSEFTFHYFPHIPEYIWLSLYSSLLYKLNQ